MKLLTALFILVFVFDLEVAHVPGQEEQKTLEHVQAKIEILQDKKLFTAKHDKFKDESTISVTLDILWKNYKMTNRPTSLQWVVGSTFDGKLISDEPRSNFLCSRSSSPKWIYLQDRDLIFLIDGKKTSIGEASHHGSVEKYGVTETLCWHLENEVLEALINAKTIEFQLGRTEGKVREQKIELLKQYGLLIGIK